MTHDELMRLRWGDWLSPEDKAIWLRLVQGEGRSVVLTKTAICAYPSYLHTGEEKTKQMDEYYFRRVEQIKYDARILVQRMHADCTIYR